MRGERDGPATPISVRETLAGQRTKASIAMESTTMFQEQARTSKNDRLLVLWQEWPGLRCRERGQGDQHEKEVVDELETLRGF